MRSGKSLTETMQQAVMPVRGTSCLCFACEASPELKQMRLLCRQKQIPLTLFVHQLDDALPKKEAQGTAGTQFIQDLLASGEAQ
jgi:hypothetical protein